MARVYSSANSYYFSGSALTGLGSPHTPHNYVWPLATAMEALTSSNVTRQATLLKVGPNLSRQDSRGGRKQGLGGLEGWSVLGAAVCVARWPYVFRTFSRDHCRLACMQPWMQPIACAFPSTLPEAPTAPWLDKPTHR
jgi:hypothetical protein